MITPDYLDEIAAAARGITEKMNTAICRRMAKRIVDSFYYYDEPRIIPATLSEMHSIMRLGMTQQEIMELVVQYTPDLEDEVRALFYESAEEIAQTMNDYTRKIAASLYEKKGLEIAVPEYIKSGIPEEAIKLNLTPAEVRLLDAAYRRTAGEIRNLTQTTASQAETAFIDACDKAFMQIKHGVSVSAAVEEAIKSVAKNGAKVVNFRSGYQESIETSISRAVRTGVNQANADIVLTRSAELGVQYVLVSEHYGARVTNTHDYKDHSWWQGQVYKLNWYGPQLASYFGLAMQDTTDYMSEIRGAISSENGYNYPSFEETCGYGDILGICGINCRHSFSPFFPDVQDDPPQTVDPERNREIFENQQKGRAMERTLRAQRRELAALRQLPDGPDKKEAIKAARNRLVRYDEKYRAFCTTKNVAMHNTPIA